MRAFLLVLFFAGVTAFEVPGLVQKKYWRELMVFALLMTVGFTLGLLMVLGVEMPKIGEGITKVVEAHFGDFLNSIHNQ